MFFLEIDILLTSVSSILNNSFFIFIKIYLWSLIGGGRGGVAAVGTVGGVEKLSKYK